MPRLPFGQWAPDLPSIVNQQGLVEAMNMLPKAGGYDPVRGLAALSGATAMSARPMGGGVSGVDGSGSGYLYGGTATTLEVQRDSGMTDVSRTPAYALGTADRWSWARHGNSIFAATINERMQHHVIGSPQPFADVPAFAPRARHIATIGNFLMAGNIYDTLEGPMTEAISWSGIDAPLLWPQFASDDAAKVQSDRQPLTGGGWVQDIVSGAEIGVVFQERAIHRLDYRGGNTIFERNQVEEGNGMFIPHSAVSFGRLVFYISENGFRIFDYVGSQAIGKDRVDQTFLSELDSQYLDRVETGLDPNRSLIWVIYPGTGNTAGRPNRIIWYDYELNRFSHGDLELEGLIQNATTTPPSIDSPGIIGDPDDDADDPAYPDGGIDSAGLSPFDDRASDFGASNMGAFGTTFVSSDFTGDLQDGLIETGDIEGTPGKMHWLDSARTLVDGKSPQISVSERDNRKDDVEFGAPLEMEDEGTFSIESEARYHRLRVHLGAGWENAVGVDHMGRPAGER